MPQFPGKPLNSDPKALDATNVPRPIMLIARPEHDGTLTLVLDAPGTDTLPTELGGGYTSIEDIKTAVFLSLTSPAIAEDRMQILEEAVGRVNELIDAANDLVAQVSELKQRVEYLEQMSGRAGIPLTRPMIPRLGERAGQKGQTPPVPLRGQYHDMRNQWDERFPYEEMPSAQPRRTEPSGAPRMPPRPPQAPQGPRPDVSEGARPNFDRGSFVPHQPVGRVSRGPGTPDQE